jgi:hypothetical protein
MAGNGIMADLRHMTIIPRRYDAVRKLNWSAVGLKYSKALAGIESSPWHWYVIQYEDGRQELTYLRVLAEGLLSGKRAAIYRGLLIPRMVRIVTFSHIKEIRLAF